MNTTTYISTIMDFCAGIKHRQQFHGYKLIII